MALARGRCRPRSISHPPSIVPTARLLIIPAHYQAGGSRLMHPLSKVQPGLFPQEEKKKKRSWFCWGRLPSGLSLRYDSFHYLPLSGRLGRRVREARRLEHCLLLRLRLRFLMIARQSCFACLVLSHVHHPSSAAVKVFRSLSVSVLTLRITVYCLIKLHS